LGEAATHSEDSAGMRLVGFHDKVQVIAIFFYLKGGKEKWEIEEWGLAEWRGSWRI